MIVLLHRYNPWHVVKCHGTQPEVCIVWNFADLTDEAVKVRRRNAIHGGDEIRRRKTILIGWGTATLQEVSTTTTLIHKYNVGTYPCTDIHLAVQLGNLLAYGVVRLLQHSTAEDNGTVGLQVLGRYRR